ncbi:DUF6607 family protein [Marinibactrum halimedae]|nr:DUF6607 family protein [Marinibactrum halimedae]MCD9461026.1 hypothetical protein [Marinibactrum halimedae]
MGNHGVAGVIRGLISVTVMVGLIFGGLYAFPAFAYDGSKKEKASECAQRFTFSWPISDDCSMNPRGGTTKGAPVTLDMDRSPQWQALQSKNISTFERDRRAILAMAGPYRTTFDFLETVQYQAPKKSVQPYQSWGTEYVYVIADEGDFISLQHMMVMVFVQEDGALSEPMVMKHWRQDWRFEDSELLEYQGDNTWKTSRRSPIDVKGHWSQAVFQVDDSPRYEAIGQWEHNASFSSWKSTKTWRPLPRRESSVRNDYQVLEGFNRHTVMATGWVQEEENLKRVSVSTGSEYIAKEQGVARYERIKGFDFSAGANYMALAGQFWADVRAVWADKIKQHPTLALTKTVEGQALFMPLFQYAQSVMTRGQYSSKEGKRYAEETIERYLITTGR